MSTPIKIKAAWYVSDHATVGGKKCGRVFARTPDDLIYKHNVEVFRNPSRYVAGINKKLVINPQFWALYQDDRRAVAYFKNAQGDLSL